MDAEGQKAGSLADEAEATGAGIPSAHSMEKGTIPTFVIVVLACALGSLTQTVMNSMLGGIAAEFGTPDSTSQWLTSVYMLTIGITVPLVTHLSRKMSTRQLTLLALGLFLFGASVDLVAPNFVVLLLGRIPQAVGAGITLPLIMAIAMTGFPPERTGTAMGISGIAMGFAPNIGPIIGGALVGTLGWRSFFWMLALVVALLIVLTLLLVPRSQAAAPQESKLDLASFMLSTLGFGGLLLAFTNAASMAVASLPVAAPFVLGVACLVLFVRRQSRIANPLISMDIFKSSLYRISFATQNCLFASFMGITLVVPLFVQNVQGLTPVDSGLVFLPATIFAIIVNPLAGILSDKIGTRAVVCVASCLLVAGSAWFIFLDAGSSLTTVTVAQTVRGIGVSALIGPLNSWGMRELPRETTMDGSAFFTCVRQACASFGTALMMLLVSFAPGALGFQLAFGLSAALSAAVLALSFAKIR